MHNPRVCTVVTGKTIKEFLDNLEKIQHFADFVELRADYISNLSPESIAIMKSKTNKKAIFTCRRKNEGGKYEGNETERKKIIETADSLGFDFIDIELSSANTFDTKNFHTKIILSFHDFTVTPPLEELIKIKNAMRKYAPSIMKFATVIKNKIDEKNVLLLLLSKEPEEQMIVTGIGENSKLIRVIAPLLDSYCTFASSEYSQSAPGQIDSTALEDIYTKIKTAIR